MILLAFMLRCFSLIKNEEDSAQEMEPNSLESPRGNADSRVWDTFAKYYPHFAGDEEWDDRIVRSFPRLGLQHPSVKAYGSSELNGRSVFTSHGGDTHSFIYTIQGTTNDRWYQNTWMIMVDRGMRQFVSDSFDNAFQSNFVMLITCKL
jgi:hypothetical protein